MTRTTRGILALAPALLLTAGLDSGETPSGEISPPRIAEKFKELTRGSRWEQTHAVELDFATHHPQGMAIVGDRFFLSSVEVLNRGAGVGRGHLFEVGFDGKLHRQIQLGEGVIYHPGGIDFDGARLWISVAEYRPDSRSIIYSVDPERLEATQHYTFEDHLGAIVRESTTGALFGVSWGSRRWYRWLPFEANGRIAPDAQPESWPNPGHYIDYQDGQSLPRTSYALFAGLSSLQGPDTSGEPFRLGGIELVDLSNGGIIHQLPLPLWSPSGRPMTQNPFAVQLRDDRLRFHFIPDDHPSTLYTFEVR